MADWRRADGGMATPGLLGVMGVMGRRPPGGRGGAVAGLGPVDARVATALVVAVLAALFGWQMMGVRQTALDEAGQQTLALARTAELQVIDSLHGAELLAAEIVPLLDGHGVGDLGLQPTLRSRLALYPELRSLVLLDAVGHVALTVARTHDAGGRQSPEHDIPGLDVPEHDIEVSRPLVAAGGVRLGTAVMAVVARPVAESLSALPLGEDGFAWLMAADGRVLAAAAGPAEQVAPPVMAKAHGYPSLGQRPRVMRLAAEDGGPERLVALQPVDGYPLVLAVGRSVDSVLASWRWNLVWYGSAVLALAVLALVYAWLFDHQSRRASAARLEQERVRAAAAAHQRGILDATIDGLVTIADDGSILGLNRSAERIFGWREAELRGLPAARLVPALAAAASISVGPAREVSGLRKDGSHVPLDLAFSELPPEAAPPSCDESGASSGRPLFIGTVRDLTERRAAETALQASEARNAAIVSAAAEGIIAVSPDGRMETVNAAAGRIFGYDPAEMIGRNLSMLVPLACREEHIRRVASHAPDEGPDILAGKRQVSGLRRTGEEFALEIAVSTLRQDGGRLFIAMVADITERMEAEAALRSAKLDAEAANQAKTQFLAHMSHELRTPLNAIIGFSDMMKQEMMGKLSPTYLDYARNINDSGRQLIGIIDDLLDVSRLQLGKFTINDGVVDLPGAVAGALAMMRPRAEDGGILLSEGMAPSLPRLKGDARAIRQLLINLVSNAVKFTPRGGSVQVSVEPAPDGRLLLVVADTGRGIPPEMIEHVLDPFHHADAFKASKTRGIGLGLPICRWLMELHGGSLTIESGTPVGTRVVAGFPKERVLFAG